MPRPAKTSGSSPPVVESLYPQQGSVLYEVYRLDTVLGEGPSGVVYHAWHLAEQRAYAVKVLHPDLGALTAALIRLRRDNQAVGELCQPHLGGARTLIGQQAPMLARPLLPAEPLRRRLQRGPLKLGELIRLFAPLCRSLAVAHDRGILHGDLKPENILLVQPPSRQGEPAPQVIDFGMWHLRDRYGGIGSHPLLGTLSYLAPEQIQSDGGALDERVDIFALGALLYECLTGRPAFDGVHPSATMAKICLGDRPRPSAFCPTLPAGLDALVERACHRLPEGRIPSMRAFWTALCEAAAEAPEVAKVLHTVQEAGHDLSSIARAPAGGETATDGPAESTDTGWGWPAMRPRRPSAAQAIRVFRDVERAHGNLADSDAHRRMADEAVAQLEQSQGSPESLPAPWPPGGGVAVGARPQSPPGRDAAVADEAGDRMEPGPSTGQTETPPRQTRPAHPFQEAAPSMPVLPDEGPEGGRDMARPDPVLPLVPVPADPEPRWLRSLPSLFGALMLLLILLLVLLS